MACGVSHVGCVLCFHVLAGFPCLDLEFRLRVRAKMKLWLAAFLVLLVFPMFAVLPVFAVLLVFLCVSWFCLCLNPT